MKTFLFSSGILLTVLFSNHIVAQNWNLISQNERYHYQFVVDTIPLNTMLIDSVTVLNGDSVFYLNRFFLPCDTCSQEGYYLDDQPGFLQRQIRKTELGVLVLENPDTIFIQVIGNVGDEWWFDSGNTQKAKMVSKKIEPVFGISDSVMTIAIDDQPQIKLSKSFGLLAFFGYSLSGLEKAGLGKCLPGFKEFYDFEVGDVFQYNGGGGPEWFQYIEKRTIKEINKTEESVLINYHVDYIYASLGDFYKIIYSYGNYDTDELYNIWDLPFASMYPNQKIIIDEMWYHEKVVTTCCQVNVYNGLLAKEMGAIDSYFEPEISASNVLYIPDEINKNLYLPITDFFGYWFYRFQPKLGLTEDWYYVFERGSHTSLIGYVKGSDTTGIVYSDSFMSGVNETGNQTQVTIFPNPASNKIVINGTNSPEVLISMYNIGGQLLKQNLLPASMEFVVSDLELGIYLVQIKTADWVITKRLVIYRP